MRAGLACLVILGGPVGIIAQDLLRSDVPVTQTVGSGVLQERIGNGGNRDSEQDADDPQQISKSDDGKQYPDPGQTDGGSHDARVDEIAFNLLEDQEHDNKSGAVPRIYKQQDE